MYRIILNFLRYFILYEVQNYIKFFKMPCGNVKNPKFLIFLKHKTPLSRSKWT